MGKISFSTKNLAAIYDQIGLNFTLTRPKLPPEVANLLPPLSQNAAVLDLGCGNGVLLTALQANINYTGLDISRVLLDEAQKLHQKQSFLLADITDDSVWTKLPPFDFIVALAILHHLPPAKQASLFSHIKDHLKPHGSALLSVWNLSDPKFDRFRTGQTLSIPFHHGIKRPFYAIDAAGLLSLTRSAGLNRAEVIAQKENLFLRIET